jgi:hypothetical protein
MMFLVLGRQCVCVAPSVVVFGFHFGSEFSGVGLSVELAQLCLIFWREFGFLGQMSFRGLYW